MVRQSTNLSVFAVVLNYNGAEDTRKCVNSLFESGYQNLHIVLVDNASPDGSAETLKQEFPSLPLIRQSENGGYAAGNNAGIRYALDGNADYVLIINNDVVVTRGFLDPMLRIMIDDPDIGAVNAKVFYQSDPEVVFSAVGEFSSLLCTGKNRGGNSEKRRSPTLECEVDFLCGVLVLIRREVFDAVGLLDEKYFMYFEDVEFSNRVRTKFKLAYTARAVAYHRSGGGKGWQNYTELYLYYHTRNRILVFENEGYIYRLYVVLFTLTNVLAKAAVLSKNYISDPSKTIRQWKALFTGFLHGISGDSKRAPSLIPANEVGNG